MNPMRPIDRGSDFWKACYLVSFYELLKREPAGAVQGVKVAALARNLADESERARRGDGEEDKCAVCRGIGCEACRFTGKADPHGGLVAPPEPMATIPIEPPTFDGTPLPRRACSCPDWPVEVDPACVIHQLPGVEHDEENAAR
jgi:hypothetical protein